MAEILGVGLATLDLITVVDGYPDENSKVHALERRRARGGNAATSLAILAQLGHRCRLAAVLGDDQEGGFILSDLRRAGVETGACQVLPGRPSLFSQVLVNRRNGSRTIVHHRALPELAAREFERVPLERLDWVHFEGRNNQETLLMLKRVAAERPGLRRSLELERARPGWEQLLPAAELVVCSRSFAEELRCSTAPQLLEELRRLAPAPDLVCAWGEQGAWASAPGEACFHAPPCPPASVVETLGAGDTFNAGLIDGLLRGESLQAAAGRANRLAGRKCGQQGIEGLGSVAP